MIAESKPEPEPEPRDPRGFVIARVGNVVVYQGWDEPPLEPADLESLLETIRASQDSSLCKLTGKEIARAVLDELIETGDEPESL